MTTEQKYFKVGDEVRLHPHDTYYKNGKILEISEFGWTFLITDCHENSGYKFGEVVFISHNNVLTLIKL